MGRRVTKARLWGLAAAALVAGCSTIQFAYNNVDWMLLEKAEHYLDLTDTQRALTEDLVRVRMETHRHEELPLYVAALTEIRAMLADGLDRDEIVIIREQIPALYRRTMRDTIPGIVALLETVDDEQIDHLRERLEERNREFQEKFMPEPLEVRLERRVERATTMIEFFTGDLRPDQVALIRHHRDAMPLTADDWLAYHRVRQAALLAMLRRGAGAAELEAFLVVWWVEFADQPPALARKMGLNREAWTQMMLELDTTLDAEQRTSVLDTLDLFIEELGALAADRTAS